MRGRTVTDDQLYASLTAFRSVIKTWQATTGIYPFHFDFISPELLIPLPNGDYLEESPLSMANLETKAPEDPELTKCAFVGAAAGNAIFIQAWKTRRLFLLNPLAVYLDTFIDEDIKQLQGIDLQARFWTADEDTREDFRAEVAALTMEFWILLWCTTEINRLNRLASAVINQPESEASKHILAMEDSAKQIRATELANIQQRVAEGDFDSNQAMWFGVIARSREWTDGAVMANDNVVWDENYHTEGDLASEIGDGEGMFEDVEQPLSNHDKWKGRWEGFMSGEMGVDVEIGDMGGGTGMQHGATQDPWDRSIEYGNKVLKRKMALAKAAAGMGGGQETATGGEPSTGSTPYKRGFAETQPGRSNINSGSTDQQRCNEQLREYDAAQRQAERSRYDNSDDHDDDH